jgi:hypothetical protein
MYLKKRTVEVFSPGSRTGPQEPRRPRFSFFHLHNFKELTPGATFVGGVGGSQASEFRSAKPSLRLPGSRPALSGIAEQWERLALGVVSGAGCIRDVSVCQHPIFNFRQNRKPKP